MTSGTIDILIKAETDEAQAKLEKLSSVIQQNLAKEGLGALASMSDRVEQAFASLEVEANQRAAGIQKAFSTLGVTSADSVKAQIQSLIEAYRQLKENSQNVSSSDMSAAYASMVAKIKAVSAAYRDAGTAAQTSGQEGRQSATAIESAWSKLGVSSTAQVKDKIQDIITAYRTLKDSGEISARDLNAAHTAMVAKLQVVASAYRATGATAKSGLGEAEVAAENTESALATLGVKSAPQVKARIQEIVAAYRTLKESGTLSARDLNTAHTSMVSQIQKVSSAYRNAGSVSAEGFGQKVKASMESLNDSLTQITGSLLSMKAAVAAALAAFASGSLFRTANQFDKFEASLKTVTGSAEAAKEAMAWVTDFATRTPYEVDKVTEAYIRLATRGFDPKTTLKVLGDTAAAFNKDLIDVVEAFTDAATFEFERLKEFGVTASVAGEQVTLSWQKNGQQMQQTVSKTGTAISKALSEIWAGNNSGAMDDLMERVGGLWSNLQDAFTQFQNAVMKDGGVWDWIRDKLKVLLASIDELKQNGKLDEYAKSLGAALQEVGEWVWTLGAKIKSVAEVVYAAMKSMAAAFAFVPLNMKEIITTGALLVAGLGALGIALLALKPVVAGVNVIIKALDFVEIAAKAASFTKAIAAMTSEFSATKAVLSGLGAGGWGMIATLVVADTVAIWKLVEAYKGWRDAEASAKRSAEALAEAKAKEKAAWQALGVQYGVIINSLDDWKKAIADGSVKLKDHSGQVALTAKEYKELGETIKKAGDAGSAYSTQVTENYDQAAKKAEKLASTEGAAAAKAVAVQNDKFKSLVSIAKATADAQIEAIKKAGGTESQQANLIEEVHKNLKKSIVSIYQDRVKDLQSAIDQMIAQEKRYASQAESAQQSTEEMLRELRRKGMSEYLAEQDKKSQADGYYYRAQQELAKGTAESIDKAYKWAEKARSAYNGLNDVQAAMQGVAASGQLMQDASEKGVETTKTAIASMEEQLQTIKGTIDDLNKNRVTIDGALNIDTSAVDVALNALNSLNGKDTKSAHSVTDNSASVLSDLDKLQGHNTTSTHTVYEKKVEAYAAGGSTTRSVPAMVMPGEVVIEPERAGPLGPLLHAINSMRVAREAVQHFDGGGGVFRPFRSGLVPGVGDEDSEPVLLPEGAFVVRKAAVQRYGAQFLQGLGKGGALQYFATGGFALPDWLRRLQQQGAASMPVLPSASPVTIPTTAAAPAVSAPSASASLATALAAPKGTSARGVAAVSRLDGLRQSAAIKFSSGGNLDETLADIALERKRTKEDYDIAVTVAQESHDDDLADLLKQEQSDLDDIAVTLAKTLQDLQDSWVEAQKSYAEAVLSERKEYESNKAELQTAVKEAQTAYQTWKQKGVDEHPGKIKTLGPKDPNSIVPGNSIANRVTATYSKDYSPEAKKALAEYQAEGVTLQTALRKAQQELRALGAFTVSDDTAETYATAQNDFATGTAEANTTAETDTQTTKAQAEADKADLEKTLADTLADLKLDYDRAMEDLDIEEARARADADDEKGYSISGFSQWLRDGGPVKALARAQRLATGGFAGLFSKALHFDSGGAVPMLPCAIAGQDSVPAVLTPGEGVVRAEAMARVLSERALDALNNLDLDGFFDALPRFNTGGLVPGGDVAAVAALPTRSGVDGSGESYTATLHLAVGGKSFETRTTAGTAAGLVRELRRAGVNVK